MFIWYYCFNMKKKPHTRQNIPNSTLHWLHLSSVCDIGGKPCPSNFVSSQAKIPTLYTAAIQAHRQNTCTPLQKQSDLEESTSPSDSWTRSAHTSMWSWQHTVYLYRTWMCCERAWKPRTASGYTCKHSNCLRYAAPRHQRDAAPPSANWDAQTSKTVMNMAAFTAGNPQCPECHLQAPKTFSRNLYGTDNAKRR